MRQGKKRFYKRKSLGIFIVIILISFLGSISYAGSTKTYQMSSSGDDTFGYSGTNFYTAITTVFGLVGVTNYSAYYRWQIDIPVGSKISYSLVSMRCYVAGSGSPELALFLIDSASCPSFASSNPSGLSVSTDSVDYAPGTWSAGVWRTVEPINKLVQHCIDNPLYTSGNYLGVRIGPRVPLTGLSRFRQTYTYDNSTSYASKLIVYYNQTPSTPIPELPATGSSTNNLQPQFIWSSSLDLDSDPIYYLFELDTVATFDSGSKFSLYSNTTNYQPGANLSPGLWFWRVLSFDSSSCPNVSFVSATSGWSSVQSVSLTVNHPPGTINLISPTESTTNTRYPRFNWSQATDPDVGDTISYRLQVDTDSSFGPSGLVLDTTALIETTYLAPTPIPANQYFWRVIVQDASFAANTSALGWFISFDSTQQRIINSQDTYLFELGSWSTSTEYTPVTLSINSVLGVDTITITVFDEKHPQAIDTTGKLGNQYFLSRWYRIDSNGNIKNARLRFRYTDSDFIDAQFGALSENQIELQKWNGVAWNSFVPTSIDTTTNWVELDNISSFSDWTFSGPGGMPVGLSRFE